MNITGAKNRPPFIKKKTMLARSSHAVCQFPHQLVSISFIQSKSSSTHHSTAHIAVMPLCTKDAEMFLHFHAFLRADSGVGRFLNPVLTSLKNPTELPVVKSTELNSMSARICF